MTIILKSHNKGGYILFINTPCLHKASMESFNVDGQTILAIRNFFGAKMEGNKAFSDTTCPIALCSWSAALNNIQECCSHIKPLCIPKYRAYNM